MNRLLVSMMLLIIALGAGATTPTAADLRPYYQNGEVCLCIHFAEPVCHDIVWVGTYNNWSTQTQQLHRFQPLNGFDGWWLVHYNDQSSSICGKAVQLKDDGSFDWQYQSGSAETWTIHSGSAQLVSNEHGEAQLEHISNAAPVIATSSAWKYNPCSTPNPSSSFSGTLPVLYIQTIGNQPVTSKDYYLTATYYLDNLGLNGYTSIASPTQPDTLQIKGRGNWTWTGFDKKPYRLKLQTKQALLGLKRNKHFGLLACADDQFGWIKNTAGYLLSRQLGLEWTPGQAPVEVVLNGDYIGLYMLTELVRVDKDRVAIVEQADLCTNQDSVTGGWLVEIDNYEEPNRIALTEPANQWHADQLIWVTPKTPEILSNMQSTYLQAEMDAINEALYANDGSASLSALLDIEEAARYYLVQELMSDCESYHGSCYLHKQMGAGEKWKFGPVWDFGNSFNDRERFIYDEPYFSQIWIGQLASHSVFQQEVVRLWKHWLYYDAAAVDSTLSAFATQITAAAQADARRWPQYDHHDVQGGKQQFVRMFNRHCNWLTQQWGQGVADQETGMEDARYMMHDARLVYHEGQILILRDGRYYDLMGRRQ